MIDPPFQSVADLSAGSRTRWAHCVVLGAICALVVGVYAWSAKPGWLELCDLDAEKSYYNLLVQGFRAGQLNVKSEVPPGLTQLADPYDPLANRPYLLFQGRPLYDMSYYQGRLYLYFGVTPALVLFWPWYELTGDYLFHKEAVVIFCSVGFLASVGLLWAVWRRYFAQVGVGVVAASTIALGLGSFIPLMLARSGVYEVAISCGYALTMVTLALIWGALHDVRRRVWWLTGASLAYGLAVGARPSLLLGAVILLVPVGAAWRERTKLDERQQVWTLLLSATGPILLIGLGLMLYNFLRFDHPLEFGQRYQLNAERLSSTMHQFSLRYLWFNFRVGFLEPAQWSSHFPFVRNIVLPPLPKGGAVDGEQLPFGVLTNIPLAWLALAAALVWRSCVCGGGRTALRWFVGAVALLFGTCALIILLHNSMCLRYQVEYLPALVLLAVLGILGLECALAGRPVWRRAARWGWGLLVAFSVSFNCFAMLERSVENYMHHATISSQRRQTDQVIAYLQKALALQPDFAEAHSALGTALFHQGKVSSGIWHLEEALRLKPDFAEAHNNLGEFLFQVGQVPKAVGHLEQAVRLRPGFANALNNLGAALLQLGRVPEAVGHYEEAVRLKPDFANAHHNLGVALFQQGKVVEAIGHLEEALRVEPEEVQVRRSLGIARFRMGEGLAAQGKWDEAIPQYQRAIELKPDYALAHDRLALALSRHGKVAEAVVHYRKALELDPQWASVLGNLAWLLATDTNGAIRNVDEAVRCAERACQLTTNAVASHLDTLAVAYSESGKFDDAVRTAQRAIELAKGAGSAETARRIEERLRLYQAGQPYHAGATEAP